MSSERYNQIIDEVYRKYADSHEYFVDGWMHVVPMEHSKETFVNECKTNPKFSNKWGLKIEERELIREERYNLISPKTGHSEENIDLRKKINNFEGNITGVSYHEEWLDSFKIPTKLITITYNNETIESYE